MKPVVYLSIALAAVAALSDVSAFGCKPAEVKGWMNACDSVTGPSKNKCDNRACHTALHRLIEQETIDCYVSSGLGAASDLNKYVALDAFCHGEGPDPNVTPAPTTAAPTSKPPTTPVVTSSAPTTSSPPSTSNPPTTSTPPTTTRPPSNTTTAPSPTASPKPQC